MDQRPRIPLAQLIDTVNTPNEDQHDGQAQKRHKHLERHGQLLATGSRIRGLEIAVRELERQSDEDAEGEDLE